jgi:hypothetical protein
MQNGRMFQGFHPIHCAPSGVIAANEDIFDGDPATDIISMSKYDKVIFFIIINANGSGGTATITVESCDTVVPGTATAIAFKYWACTTPDTWGDMQSATASGFTTSATADNMYAIEVNSSELYSTDSFVRMQCTEVVDQPVDGAIMAIAGGARYLQEVKPTALA